MAGPEIGSSQRGGGIREIKMESGKRLSGKMFIDATHEGDLLAAAGVSYRVGREALSEYGEKWNGVQVGAFHHPHHFGKMRISPPGIRRVGFCR